MPTMCLTAAGTTDGSYNISLCIITVMWFKVKICRKENVLTKYLKDRDN